MGGAVLFRFNPAIWVAALAASLLVLASSSTIHAQAPTPTPPITAAAGSDFTGTVGMNGSPAPGGTPIEAVVRGTVCGIATTQGGQYGIRVKSGIGEGADFQQGCGQNGDTVTFRTGSLTANEHGQFVGHTIQQLNLTFGQAGTPTGGAGLPSDGYGPSVDQQNGMLLQMSLLVLLGLACLVLAAAIRLARRSWSSQP